MNVCVCVYVCVCVHVCVCVCVHARARTCAYTCTYMHINWFDLFILFNSATGETILDGDKEVYLEKYFSWLKCSDFHISWWFTITVPTFS